MTPVIMELLISQGIRAALKLLQMATGPDGTIDEEYLRKQCKTWEELEEEILGKKKDG